MIVSSSTVNPQNVRACATPGTVHFSSLRCPITSVGLRRGIPPGMRPHRRDPLRSGLPAHRQPPQPPQPPPRDRERDHSQDQADGHPQDHANLLSIRSSSVAMQAAPQHDHVRTTGAASRAWPAPDAGSRTVWRRRGVTYRTNEHDRRRSLVMVIVASRCGVLVSTIIGGHRRERESSLPWAGIFSTSAKLSLYDSSHLTAVAPAGKLEPELLNFIHTQLHTHKDCSWHVR